MPTMVISYLLPIRSGINVFSIRLIQAHGRNDSPSLHTNPGIDTHNAVLIKRHSNLSNTSVPNAIAAVARVLAKAQKWPILTTSATDPVTRQSAVGPSSTPAVSVVVSGVDRMQTRRVEQRLHKGNGLGTGVGVALLSEWDVFVKAGIVGTGHVGGVLGLKIDECEHGYVDKCQGWKSPVLALLRFQ